MKFVEINLLAYGPFTNRILSFPADGPNLHLIYGRNEAGKSTALRAISGFLYEIEVQTRDDFIHEKSELRIGARLRHSCGAERAFIRKKGKPGTTLLDSYGRPISESELKSWLSISDRDLFRQMFGLSHEQLRAAGAALANAEDDAGRMLFGAALNGTALQQVLADMEKEMSSESRALREALKKFNEKRKSVSAESLSIKDWEALNSDLENARAEANRAEELFKQSSAERARIQRIQRVLPFIAQRADLLQQRAEMGNVRLMSADVSVARRELQRERDQVILPGIDRIRERMAGYSEEREGLTIPKALLAESDRIRQLAGRLAQYRKERMDLPGVSRSIIDFENHEKQILAELGLSGLAPAQRESIRIDAPTRQRIQDLDRERTECSSGLEKLRRQIEAKKSALRQTEENLAKVPEPPNVVLLKAAWNQLDDRAIDEKIRRSEADLRDLDAAVVRARLATAPWGVSPELTGVEIPA
jgi:uncharacterized protein YhaN